MAKSKKMKLKHKIILPNLLYLLLLGVAVYFFFSSSAIVKNISTEQETSNHLTENVFQTTLTLKAYMNKEVNFDSLQKEYEKLLTTIHNKGLAEQFSKLWEHVNKVRDIRKANSEIEQTVMELTSSAIKTDL